MIEKKWTVVRPTLRQLAPVLIVAGSYSYFAILSDLQFCVNDAYNLLEITLSFAAGIMLCFYVIKMIHNLFYKKLVGIYHILFILLLSQVSEYNPRLDMLAQTFFNHKKQYLAMADGIIKSNILKKSNIFEYYDYVVPDGQSFCFRGISAMRLDNAIFILFPVDIHNDISKRSYFEGFLYSATGTYPLDIFPPKQTQLLRKLDNHWYIIYESPPDRTRMY